MKRNLILIVIILLIGACGGKKKNAAPVVVAPGKSSLLSPAENEACTTGNSVSSTESTVQFSWTASSNTESYVLNIKNLLTNITTSQTVTGNTTAVSLLKDTPYSWYVVSKSSKTSTTTQSDTWKFYNAGDGKTNYAPFPAEIVSPTYNQVITASGGKITLDWNGSDTDGDIVNYDVYLGASNSPALLQANVTASILNNVSVNSTTTYYWRIITRDSKGNTSDSGLYRFTVN
jgi:hypothetical protein